MRLCAEGGTGIPRSRRPRGRSTPPHSPDFLHPTRVCATPSLSSSTVGSLSLDLSGLPNRTKLVAVFSTRDGCLTNTGRCLLTHFLWVRHGAGDGDRSIGLAWRKGPCPRGHASPWTEEGFPSEFGAQHILRRRKSVRSEIGLQVATG